MTKSNLIEILILNSLCGLLKIFVRNFCKKTSLLVKLRYFSCSYCIYHMNNVKLKGIYKEVYIVGASHSEASATLSVLTTTAPTPIGPRPA
jgi:hypothetical protein